MPSSPSLTVPPPELRGSNPAVFEPGEGRCGVTVTGLRSSFTVAKSKVASEPRALVGDFDALELSIVRIGLEAGPL